MARIIEFEGRQIEVPDDATDAEVEEILTGQAPQVAPAASVALKAPSLVDTVMSGADYLDDTAAIGLTGARKGVSAVLGLPVDIVNNAPRVLNALPGVDGVGPISDTPFMGSDFIDAIFGAPADAGAAAFNAGAEALGSDNRMAGAEGPQPQDVAQRFVGRIGQEVGAAAVPVGAGLSLGARGVQAARELPWIAMMFAEPAAINPGRFAGREAAAAVGAGTGGAAANEIVDKNTAGGQIADLVGAITGAGLTGLGRTLAGGVKQTFDAVRQNPNYVDQVVKDAVVDRLGKAANLPGSETAGGTFDTDPLVGEILRGSDTRPSEVIPGYQESLADRTGNAGLAALEYGRQQGPNSGMFTQRRSANTEAVDSAMSQLEPQATPGALRDELDLERTRRLTDAGVARQMAEDDVAAAVMGLQPQSTPAQRGNTVRTALEDARDVARQRTEDAYAAANIAGKQVDPAPLTESLDNALAGLTEVERGLVPQGVIDRVAALGRPAEASGHGHGGNAVTFLDAYGVPIQRPPAPPQAVDLKQATDLKSELLRLQRAAAADPRAERGGRNAARVLGQMADTVDGFISRNLTPDEAAALDTARGARFEEAQAFGRQGDPVAAALARNEGGVPKMRDDLVAGSFVNPQAMDRLFAEADTPAVRQAIRDEVLSRGDTSSAERIARFQSDYAEQLQRFPGLSGEIGRAARARTAEAGATASEQALQRDLGTDTQPGRGTVGRYLQYSDANSEKAISEVLSAKDPGKAADEMLTFINDKPQAVEGARAAFWKKLRSESQSVDATQRSMGGKRAWRGDWLKGWLDNPGTAAVAERLYRDNPEHLERVRAIANVLDNADLRVRGKATGSSGTTQGISNIMTPETLQSRGYAYMRGQISGTYLATSIAAVMARRAVRGARTEAIERVTDKALLDSDFAAALLKENNPANRAILARGARGWLGNEASTFVNLLNESDDETENKVMEGANGR
ncbi:hypothetical protein [Aminobacter sp. BE322]|uniref:hypothetical protein n=1 Tax=unclassified Aminobacter TaxID=2644704 RepID=UPI003D237142